MMSISEKDGATIIVIENPTESEQRFIEQAKKTIELSDVWAKFKCNQKKENVNPAPESITVNLDEFEEITLPF